MKLAELLKLVVKMPRTHYFVVAPDDLGLLTLLPKVLKQHCGSVEDVTTLAAYDLTKENARKLERETRLAPRGGSDVTNFFIHSLQKIPEDSVGPLLKTVEEAKFARFIFQAQSIPKKVNTLRSRSHVVKLSFLPKQVVLGNLKAMNFDAKTADQLNLYDGTLDGTRKALAMKDTMASIKREFSRGLRGYTAIIAPDMLGSLAFEAAVNEFLTEEELVFMRRDPSPERKKLSLLLAMNRVQS